MLYQYQINILLLHCGYRAQFSPYKWMVINFNILMFNQYFQRSLLEWKGKAWFSSLKTCFNFIWREFKTNNHLINHLNSQLTNYAIKLCNSQLTRLCDSTIWITANTGTSHSQNKNWPKPAPHLKDINNKSDKSRRTVKTTIENSICKHQTNHRKN